MYISQFVEPFINKHFKNDEALLDPVLMQTFRLFEISVHSLCALLFPTFHAPSLSPSVSSYFHSLKRLSSLLHFIRLTLNVT